RGLTSWEQAAAVFAGSPYRYEECTVSYRTTAEITRLANRVRRGTADVAQAFERHGPEPELVAAAGEAEVGGALVRSVERLRARGYGSVAIIAKTAERARAMGELLARAGGEDVAVVTQPNFDYRGGAVVLPVWLAKGLEFDASIVVDADA